MAIIREFRCPGHGPFEATEPVCPHGCTAGVVRDFRTPVGISTGGRTQRIDATIAQLAKDFGVSDFNNHGGTTAARVTSPDRRAEAAAQHIRQRFGDKPWGTVPKGGAPAVSAQFGGAPSADLSILKSPDIPRKPVIHTRHADDAALLAKVKAA